MQNPFLTVLKREIEKIKSAPIILVVMIAVPIIVCFILLQTFAAGSPKNLPIAVVDNDNTNLSRKIIRMIDSTPSCSVKYKIQTINEGKDLILSGKIYGLILIPKDFKKDVLSAKRPKLVYYYNNQLLLIGGIITKDVNTAIQTLMGGITVEIYSRKGLPRDIAISQVNIIKVDEHVLSNPYINYSYLLSTAAFIHTFQILIIFIAIWSFGVEFKDGTSKELLACGNNSILTIVSAKLFPYTLSFFILMSFIYWIYFVIYGSPFQGSIWFSALATLAFILAYQLIGIAFVAISGNLRFSFSSGAFFTSLGFTLEGMTFPNIAMPAIGRYYSALLPLRPYLAIMIDQSQRGFPYIYDLGYLLWIIALGSIGIILLPLLKIRMNDENQWYKI